jgi:sister-chromatid-cohesion protein PDS5
VLNLLNSLTSLQVDYIFIFYVGRFEVVTAIVSTARKDFDLVAKNESLLNNVKERTLDKKFKIRKEALTGLALIYKKHLSDPLSVPDATKSAVTWIKDKILHGE